MQRILLAIDDAALRSLASDYLSGQGYLTATAASREAANKVMQEDGADVLVLDASGCAEEVLLACSAIRSISPIPLIVLTARDDSEERIRGLDAGADDYLVKPFNPRELVARIRVVSRRAWFARGEVADRKPSSYRFGEWRLDLLSHTLRHADGSARVLTASEFRLLEVLVTHAQKLLPRARLLWCLHGREWNRYETSIEARMSRLRLILRDRRNDGSVPLIQTVYGAGYLFGSAVAPEYP